MARSRYSDTEIMDAKNYRSYLLPRKAGGYAPLDLLAGVKTVDYLYKQGDRLDHLAAKFLGDDQYWWIIALVNEINYPFPSGGLVSGRILKIPKQASDVLDKLLR